MEQDLTGYHRLSWESELPHGCVRVARHIYLPEKRGEFGPHDHEFAEFMWVEFGRVEHLINGGSETLEPGDWRCIRPADVHRPRSDGFARSSVVNISFRIEPVVELARRCGEDWPWRPGGSVRGGRLTALQRERLSAWIDILSSAAPRQLDLDSFLMDLARMLSAPAGSIRASGLPPWLSSAVDIFADPRRMRDGVPGLARICGRSREHVNRTVRACQGRRATDLVNAIRLDWVAAQLHATDRPVEELAEACGLPNLAHFYKLFRAAFGVTPVEWRRSVRSAFPPGTALNVAPWGPA